ncbi:MAG TPA: hypothetical protein VGR37_23770 [Longimicrobiaceae bacterium]|nr:hypothetical protein [Longimicrobiaceae bacterium]
MINRLKEYHGEPEERAPEDDYFEITSEAELFYVSQETARRIVHQLRRFWVPRWIRFTDLCGSEVEVRSRLIESVHESTTTQRQARRDFHRARKLERKADRRPWDDDE